MNKLLTALTSRTVWTCIALVLLNGIPTIKDLIPSNIAPFVNSFLAILAMYFRVNPQANL